MVCHSSRESPQQRVVGKGARREWPVDLLCECTESPAAEQGLEAGALLRSWCNCQDRARLVQISHHLFKEQKFGQRDMGEVRGNHDWDKGYT